MNITVKKGSIIKEKVDAIVCPTNSVGHMGTGISGYLRKVGGNQIEDEAIHQAPINIGTAVLTTPGVIPVKNIIQAPTIESPFGKTDQHKIKCAVEAALELAEKEGFEQVAMVGMGVGSEGLTYLQSAKTMIKAIKAFKTEKIQEVILVDLNQEMVDAWMKFL
jgi:O-acetyl-ADP-ribose deacetylase (regulator of RNase III)